MLNSYQFSAAKDLSETKALQSLALTTNSFKEFREKAAEIVDINRDQWLRVEMDTCKRGAIMGEKFRNMEADKDLYPYWRFTTRDDDRVRDEHAALEGKIFRIGDPEGDSCYPPLDFNCRCTAEQLDDRDTKGKEISKGSDYLTKDDPETKKPYVSPEFRFNPGKQTLPNDSSYSEILSSANKLKAKDFEL